MLLPAADPRPDAPVDDTAAEARDVRGDDRLGVRIGVYRLREEIGRSAYAAVWLAERADGHFEREVALKLLQPPGDGAVGTPPPLAWIERMATERKLAARLRHPHIAPVFDAGVDERGRPYLVSARVLGSDIVQHARRRRLAAGARLQLLLQACDAVSHVHGLHWAHGRLKPSNLRVDDDGQVQLLDCGLSRLLAGWWPPAAGAVGGPAATPFDAPEHRTGQAPSMAQDIHALGRVLQALMENTPGEAALRRDLQAVVARATATDPLLRYDTVQALADDLRQLADHRPVQAAPADRLHGLALWARRHALPLAGGVALLVVLLAVGAGLWQQRRQAQALDERDAQARAFMVEALPASGRDAQHWQAALARARQGFEGEPALRGQVLALLGVAGRELGQPAGALQALGEAHGLLQRVAPADDAARLRAAVELAGQQLLAGLTDSEGAAAATARQALAGCREASLRCAEARAGAQWVLGLVAGAQNDPAAQRQAEAERAREQATARRLSGGP